MLPEKCHDLKCSGYWGLLPLLILGIGGCAANLVIMNGPGFKGQSFFFLRALSVSDMMYLFFSVGNFVEMMFFQSWSHTWSTGILLLSTSSSPSLASSSSSSLLTDTTASATLPSNATIIPLFIHSWHFYAPL